MTEGTDLREDIREILDDSDGIRSTIVLTPLTDTTTDGGYSTTESQGTAVSTYCVNYRDLNTKESFETSGKNLKGTLRIVLRDTETINDTILVTFDTKDYAVTRIYKYVVSDVVVCYICDIKEREE